LSLLTKSLCLFCQTQGEFLYSISSFNLPFKVHLCPSCGLIYQNPMPNPETIQNLYQEGYYSGKACFSYEDERKLEKYSAFVWKARVKKLKKSLKIHDSSPRFLDIGCAFGGLLKEAQNSHFTSYGVELSDYSRTEAEKFFKDRVFKDFLQAPFKENFFDAISMIEVIEHLHNPLEYLQKSYQILKKGGVLLVQTANMEARQAKKAKEKYHYFLPGHLVYFSKKNLRNKLLELGFSKVKIFHPVEFGLLPKLKKSKGSFTSLKDYFKWFKIAFYHFKSKLYFKDRCFTSSMVVYAWK